MQKEYAADMKIFDWYGAALDQGKILLYILYENDPGGAMAYFFDEGHKKRRIHTSTFYRLLAEGKAVRVKPDEFEK